MAGHSVVDKNNINDTKLPVKKKDCLGIFPERTSGKFTRSGTVRRDEKFFVRLAGRALLSEKKCRNVRNNAFASRGQ